MPPEPCDPQSEKEPEIDEEIFPFFVAETKEWLKTLENELHGFAAHRKLPERLAGLKRLFHTLKGASFSVGHEPIGTLAGEIEQLLKGITPEQARRHEVLLIRACLTMAEATRAYLERQEDPSHAPRRGAKMAPALADIRELACLLANDRPPQPAGPAGMDKGSDESLPV